VFAYEIMNDVDWKKTWVTRGKDYHSANASFPAAREGERDLLLERLELRDGQVVLDVAAGGGYLLEKVHQRLGDRVCLLAIESSETFAANLPSYVSRLAGGTITKFPLPDESVDRVSNLSGLHHSADRHLFFEEAFRVLKSGGIMGAADVRQGSPVARWLNEFVDHHNPQGHQGIFFQEGEMTRLGAEAGFAHISEETVHYSWNFDSVDRMIWFCRTLFGINADDDIILNGITEILGWQHRAEGIVAMNWELIRTVGQKNG
jgi:ubiquinone/menaquinone biosynthesis C-methylase UbiE